MRKCDFPEQAPRRRHQVQRLRRDARCVQQPNEARCDQRRGFSRLRHHRVARTERRGHLTGKYRQRKVPGTDTGKNSAALQYEVIHLAGRPLEALRSCEPFARLQRIVAAVIHRFAHLRDRVRDGLARLPHQQLVKLRPIGFKEIGSFFQTIRPRLAAVAVPSRLRIGSRLERHLDFVRGGVARCADLVAPICRVGDRMRGTGPQLTVDDGSRRRRLRFRGTSCDLAAQGLKFARIAQVDSAGIVPIGI